MKMKTLSNNCKNIMNCIYDAVDKFSQIYWGILCRPVATVISSFMIFSPPFIQYNVQSCSYNLRFASRKSAKQQSKILNSLKYPNFIWPKPSSRNSVLFHLETWKPFLTEYLFSAATRMLTTNQRWCGEDDGPDAAVKSPLCFTTSDFVQPRVSIMASPGVCGWRNKWN